MHLCLIFFLCAVVYGINRISEPDLKAVNFADEIERKKLDGSLIREVEVDSESSCQLECLGKERCQSYNFGTIMGDSKKFKCQLSGSDRFAGFANFTEDNDFIYRGIKSACEEDSFQCGEKGICIPNYNDGSVRCKCDGGYTGKPCSKFRCHFVLLFYKNYFIILFIFLSIEARSCYQLFQDGLNSGGVYTINPDGGKPIQVLCDMNTDSGGWTVFQRRLDGSVDFYRGWESYKNGFGNLNGEFWLGNDNVHRLTDSDDVMLRIDLEDFEGNIAYAEYTTFKVADEADKYRLLIGGYNGTAGDSMAEGHSLSNMSFTTKDEDNDFSGQNCALLFKGAWWYNDCHHSNLNGLYHGGLFSDSPANGVSWNSFRGAWYSLKRSEMKMRPSN
ncbi:unnamed protein product [Pocillopora meandrina]|uniref:Uncharacterized protein n=1 Tax=Pocillopora meandrina TaxID=46732 RepID=A0AAU9X868_9CNID|nr:unnamed protein product [Pocillopora meandrina]